MFLLPVRPAAPGTAFYLSDLHEKLRGFDDRRL
jgi:hypothetical protein